MKKNIYSSFILLSFILLLFGGCDKEGHINILTVEQDKELGTQVAAEIEGDPATYPILPETGRNGLNENAYRHIRRITSTILNSGQVTYKDEFPWQVKIIHDDSTLNAFATPGGYIYVYTGLIKYLDTEDQLAGVMGHEIAHADKRHTSRNITREYGFDLVVSALLGQNPGAITQIARGLAGLSYSRAFEREADDFSVVYLDPTDYQCNGAAGFFVKINQASQDGRPPQWLSTHPNPDNRVEAINAKADELGCDKTALDPGSFEDFKNSLP
jgi:predicted Zn-dependent protease